MKQRLPNADVIKLIKLYRSHSLLWDAKNKYYRRTDLRTKAFDDIAWEMGLPVELVKEKIHSLRSTYTGEKRKMSSVKKSGSGAEETYIPTLSWFYEMSFLDSSIVSRKAGDNSNEDNLKSENLEDLEDFEEINCNSYFADEPQTRKSPEEQNAKLDEALEKLISVNENENEFTAFAASIAHQLQKFPEEDGYELIVEIQNLVTQRKIKNMREQRKKRLVKIDSVRVHHK